jgi:hypothetical protein
MLFLELEFGAVELRIAEIGLYKDSFRSFFDDIEYGESENIVLFIYSFSIFHTSSSFCLIERLL